jgi:hypothetical protein
MKSIVRVIRVLSDLLLRMATAKGETYPIDQRILKTPLMNVIVRDDEKLLL